MTHNRSILILVLTAALLVASTFVIRWRYHVYEENEVYLGFAAEILKGSNDVAFVSFPSACDAEQQPPIGSAELWASFVAANSRGAQPIRLSTLEGRYHLVTPEATKLINDTQGMALLFRSTPKAIVKLSRVGFDRSRANALFCVEGPPGRHRSRFLIWLHETGGNWRTTRTEGY